MASTNPVCLRTDQQEGLERMLGFLSKAGRGDSLLLSAPTGYGKSYLEIALLKALPPGSHYQIVPNLDIARGLAEKLGAEFELGITEPKLRRETEALCIFTSERLKNLLCRSRVPLPLTLCFDEAHHSIAETGRSLWDLCGRGPRVGLTATTYRGTPQGTRELRDSWGGNVQELMSLRVAVKEGIISLPSFSVWPLINDDLIGITNGEFVTSQVDAAVKDKMENVIERMSPWWDGSRWDTPTMLAFSSVSQVEWAKYKFDKAGLGATVVTGKTLDRPHEFAKALARTHVLLQIRVVGEGVDLPLRRLIDFAPTMSPVKWMQLVGRITRPWAGVPEYIACCHNLSRHAYLWHGLIPAERIKVAQAAWGPDYKPSGRSMARAIGLEGFGRFAPVGIPLVGGVLGSFYGLQTKDGSENWAVFLHPIVPTPLYFYRKNSWAGEYKEVVLPTGLQVRVKQVEYGRWVRMQHLPEVAGCVSLSPQSLTPGQQVKWKNEAGSWGLDPDVVVNAKQFALLPILQHTGIRIKEVK